MNCESRLNGKDIIDVYAASAPGSLTRSAPIDGQGLFRVARRNARLISVLIIRNAWGRARVLNGRGRPLWFQPSLFAGSFNLNAHAEDGIIIENDAREGQFILSWNEADQEII